MPIEIPTVDGCLPSLRSASADETPAASPSCAPSAGKTAPRTKVGFISLGCPKNLVDSEVMMGLLASSGAEITNRADDADIIVINTCSFIESAQQESVNTILEMAKHKVSESNPHGRARKLVVAGCLVERFRNDIQKDIPEVDAVVGTGELEKILQAAGIEPQSDGASHSSSPFTILQS